MSPTTQTDPSGGPATRLRIGWIEPHLRRYGGIRRVLELANRLVARGHDVTIYLPDDQPMSCDWMRCDARIRPVTSGFDDQLDVLIFNDEPQWHLIDLFRRADKKVFYALHAGRTYDKAGSWESVRSGVDLILANSTWTADMIEEDTGVRPPVVLGGVNPDHFRPVEVAKEYDLLCVGERRAWKGQGIIDLAAELAGVQAERYSTKDLAQSAMAEEYSKARVFAVGSRWEGFGQPGLEALACGVPLVTTDNGGCRDYAIHEQTAMVVPPDDPDAMAAAIRRLLDDRELAARLIETGLELVAERFDWDRAAEAFEGHLAGLASGDTPPLPARRPRQDVASLRPEVTVVVLAWDQLYLTQRCVQSVRQRTDVPYELVLVDNGSAPDAVHYAKLAADVPVLNDRNTGFAHGMQQGLDAASARFVAFVNNDTVLPEGWASTLIKHLEDERVGLVVPAVTHANDPRIVRDQPGEHVEVFDPFEAPPPAVVLVGRAQTLRELGGWDQSYEVASGEDMDLAFTTWTNGLEIVHDSRVLVQHVSKGTAHKLGDWRSLWARNRGQFLDRWTDPTWAPPRIPSCPPEVHAANIRHARAAAGWMRRSFDTLERQRTWREHARSGERRIEELRGHLDFAERKLASGTAQRLTLRRLVLAAWRRGKRILPAPVEIRVYRAGRRLVRTIRR